MTRSVAGKRKQKTATRPPMEPVEVAKLSRYDFAVSTGKAVRVDVIDAQIANPIQVTLSMRASYAEELLRQLRVGKKQQHEECYQISIDCPVEIVVDGETLKMMIDELQRILAVEVQVIPRGHQ